MVGGCSRDPFSRSDLANLADLGENLFYRTKETLDGFSDRLSGSLDRPGPKPISEADSETEARLAELEAQYTEFLKSLELRYIQPREIIRAHLKKRDEVANGFPPEKLWKKMVPTVRVADEIRHRLGKRMLCVYSAYRSPEYNAKCPGAASRSYHMKNCALDLQYDCAPAKVAEVAKKLRDEKFFKGGIGIYKGFVHIDTRGYNATWDQVAWPAAGSKKAAA